MSEEPAPPATPAGEPAPAPAPAAPPGPPSPAAPRRALIAAAVLGVVAVVTFLVTGLLVTIVEHRQEARRPFVRVVEVDEVTTDPEPWGLNWPRQFDSYRRTVDTERTRYGGSSAIPEQRLEQEPWLRRLYAGYAFSLDYREARGHAYMLHDQEHTERVTQRQQPGACLHCHASVVPTWRRLGLEAMGKPAGRDALAAGFDWPAVMKGFEVASTMPYVDAHRELTRTPDGSLPGAAPPLPSAPDAPPGAAPDDSPTARALAAHGGRAHPVSCVDCHDPQTMAPRVTRPGFMVGVAALARSDDPVPHLPSIERWRRGDRSRDFDPNVDAGRQEMRSLVCAQCHVEYYCGPKQTLFFPWSKGLKAEQIEADLEARRFPDGSQFHDWIHGETGAPAFKAQHPEFELWSQGIHARAGVSCADCHMPYEREGAMKVSSHWVRSPLLNVNKACQSCHNVPEAELVGRVHAIQDRTKALIDRAAEAMTGMLDAIREAQAAGASAEALAPALARQRKAMWRLDFVSSENSRGFHADQEAARLLGESIDYSRQAQVLALRLRAPAAPSTEHLPAEPVQGVTPTEKAPPGPYREGGPAR